MHLHAVWNLALTTALSRRSQVSTQFARADRAARLQEQQKSRTETSARLFTSLSLAWLETKSDRDRRPSVVLRKRVVTVEVSIHSYVLMTRDCGVVVLAR